MTKASTYCLKGYGELDPLWVKDLLALFRSQSVNIRKLVLLKAERPDVFAVLEVVFALPGEDSAQTAEFLSIVEQQLALSNWQARSLQLV